MADGTGLLGFMFLVGIASAFACACMSGIVASEKGHNGLNWFLLGGLFGPFALLGAIGLPVRQAEPKSAPADNGGIVVREPGVPAGPVRGLAARGESRGTGLAWARSSP